MSILVLEQKKGLFAPKIPPRRGDGIGQGRPKAYAILVEEVRSLCTRMETIEAAQRRAHDERDEISSQAYSAEEVDEDNETTKFIKMLEKVGGKPKVEIPMYEGSLNTEELMDWMRSLDQYFDYEEVDERKMVKFAVTRLRGHVAI